jgi:hypothetical protein
MINANELRIGNAVFRAGFLQEDKNKFMNIIDNQMANVESQY